jgi:glycerophosphoryl diester phosphodiesterase
MKIWHARGPRGDSLMCTKWGDSASEGACDKAAEDCRTPKPGGFAIAPWTAAAIARNTNNEDRIGARTACPRVGSARETYEYARTSCPRSNTGREAVPRSCSLAFRFCLNLLALLAWLSFPAYGAEHRLDPRTPEGLRDLFQRTGEALPVLSAHRGGPMKGFPENCLATFSNTLQHTFSLMEIDPRYTKDGQIVIFHDPTLERASTGRGRVADHTLAELRRLQLKDTEGNVTPHWMATLDEALEWARGRTILVLDQKDVPVTVRVNRISEHKAEGFAMVIVNSFKDAQAAYALNTNVLMEVMIPNRAKVAEFEKLGIPWRNVVAFVGHAPPEDRGLYATIHAKGANCMIGTSRHLDLRFIKEKMTSLQPLEPEYRAFLGRGADLIETDIPVQLGPLLFGSTPVPPTKRKYFSRN